MTWSFDVSKMYKDHFVAGFQCDYVKGRFYRNGIPTWRILNDNGDGYGAQIGFEHDSILFIDLNDILYQVTYPAPNNSVFTIHERDSLPPDPIPPDTVIVPKTFQIQRHCSVNNPIFGFTELFERTRPRLTNPDGKIWKRQSDIYLYQPTLWRRQITEFAIAPSNKNYIYIVVGGQIDPTWGIVPPQLYRSTTGFLHEPDTTFRDLSDSLPFIIPGDTSHPEHPIITGIAVHPSDPEKLWLCFTGYYADKKVCYSSDAGATWSNYDTTGSLPNLPINGIVYQEGTNNRLYIATDAGVYVKNDSVSN
jgi:hypothetical protein